MLAKCLHPFINECRIFYPKGLQKSKTISNFVERNPQKRQQETDIFLDIFSDPNRDSLTGFYSYFDL